MIALFLGAGFSKWAANLPVANELFDFNIQPWTRENKKLDRVKELKREWDKLNPQGQAEQFIADALKFQEKDKKLVLWYIVRRLSEPFIWEEFHAQRMRRHILEIDENRKYGIDGVINAKGFLDKFISILNGIVTTNYDLLIEYAIGTERFNYGIFNEVLTGSGPYPVSQWLHPVQLKGNIQLAKIHGSISWGEYTHYTDGRKGLTGNALIVAPTPEKERPNSLSLPWQVAKEILAKTTRLIVFGFGFNPYDQTVLDLLRSNSSNIQSVLIIDKKPNVKMAKRIWSSAVITTSSPPPEGNYIINEWFQKF
jgi:hypothetical protein